MLIILGGLPGSGKSTIAKQLARKLGAVYLRVDTIEQAIKRSNIAAEKWNGPEGYFICYELAKDKLALGHAVIADTVNPISETRSAWLKAADCAGAKAYQVEILCSDKSEHQHRVETRTAEIEHHQLPTWQNVIERNYQPWINTDLQLDTATLSVTESLAKIVDMFKDSA